MPEPKQTILVVDDEPAIQEYIAENLIARHYEVLTANTGLEAMALLKAEKPDLILLDIMMPFMDGFETCRRIRQTDETPIIMLTALGEEKDKVMALDLGADDYITKPFGVDELLARMRAIFRRNRRISSESEKREQIDQNLLTFKALELNLEYGSVLIRGENIKLTRTEFELLAYLMRFPGKILSHSEILAEIWGGEHTEQPEYLRVYIGRLRNKIELDSSNPEFIFSEYGAGYRFGTL